MPTLKKSSIVDSLKELPKSEREEFVQEDLTRAEAKALLYDWEAWARDSQLPPPEPWAVWLIMSGRGWGKNRTAAELVRGRVETGRSRKILLVSKNPQDAREDMIEADHSGLLTVHPPETRPRYEPGNKRVLWPNGALAHVRTGAKPSNIRGGGYDLIWMDELAAWDYPRKTYDQIQFTNRQGKPKQVITTTPQPIPVMEELVDREDEKAVHITRGTTYENRRNLSDDWFEYILKEYEGTRLGRQELRGELLTSNPDALWDNDIIKEMDDEKIPRTLNQVVVGVDPATTNNTDSDETGIIVAARNGDTYFVLDNASGKYSPNTWASKVVTMYDKWNADYVVPEKNQGGDMVESTVKNVADIPVDKVNAMRGKQTRAEPVASLYEQGRVYHRRDPKKPDLFDELIAQYTTWTPGDDSPDQLDAAVWAIRWLKGEVGKYSGGSPGP